MKIFYLPLFFLSLSSESYAESKNTAPYDALTGYNRDYYFSLFDYTMDNIKEEKPFHWEVGGVKGDISVGKKYTSKSKYVCRDFIETFVVNKEHGKSEGVACKRKGKDGWCRLKREDVHTCALETPQSTTDKILNDVDGTLGKSDEFLRKAGSLWR
jgi:hypothetical protein